MMRAIVDAGMRWSPVQVMFRRAAATRLAVLAYHGVEDPVTLDRQLRMLRRLAQPVSLDDVIESVTGGMPLPRHPVLVTFDDGHPSVLKYGLPALRRNDIPACVFVLPGLVDTDEPFWWVAADQLIRTGATAAAVRDLSPVEALRRLKRLPDSERLLALHQLRDSARGPFPRQPQLTSDDLRTLRDAGVAIGNHTMTHPCLDRCPQDVLDREIRAAHRRLTEILSEPPAAFAYPNGNWDARAEEVIVDLGYSAAFLFDHRLSTTPPTHPLRICRLRVNSGTSLDRFATIVSGMHPAIHHLRGRQ